MVHEYNFRDPDFWGIEGHFYVIAVYQASEGHCRPKAGSYVKAGKLLTISGGKLSKVWTPRGGRSAQGSL